MNKPDLSKWTALIIFAAVIAILIGVFVSSNYLKNSAKDDIENNLDTVLGTTFEAFQIWRNKEIKPVQQWAHHGQFRNYISNLLTIKPSHENLLNNQNQQDIRTLLQGWILAYGSLGYFVISPEGINLASSRDVSLGQKNLVKTKNPHLFDRVLRGETVVTLPMKNDVDLTTEGANDEHNTAIMFAMVPLYDKNGKVEAIFAVRINSSGAFSTVFQSGRLALTGETYAFDSDGRMVSKSRFDKQLRKMGILGISQDSVLNVEIRDPGINLVEGGTAPLARENQPFTFMAENALSGLSGRNLVGYNDYRGVPVIGVWLWDDESKIGITTEIDIEEAFRGLESSLNTLYFFSSICIMILALSYFVSLKVSSHFDEIAHVIARKQAEQKRILDSAGEGIYGIDNRGRATFINPIACEALGFSKEELLGNPLHFLIHHSYADGSNYPKEKCHMYKTFNDGEVHHITNEVLWRKDGSKFPVSYTSSPIWLDGKIEGAVVNFRDISEDIEIQKKLESAKKEAEAANQAKSTFLSSMSHELRTPLNAVLGFGQVLKNDPENLSKNQLSFIDEILIGGSHLLDLVNDILELSKIDAGEMTLSIENVNPRDIFSECFAMVSMLAHKNEITLINATENKVLPDVHTDYLRLKQALINILTNAIKYNSIKGNVVLDVEELNNRFLRISVTDTGNGIPQARLKELWEPFNRLGAEGTNVEGTGIGLSITKKVIDMVGGLVDVKSEVGVGTKFWIDIPLALKKQAGPSLRASGWIDDTEKGKHYDFGDFKSKKVLYVEENLSNRLVIESIFTAKTGVELCLANSGEEGLRFFEVFKPDLILLDINLPDMDGFSFKNELKNYRGGKEVPVVALTADASKQTHKKAMKSGFSGFVTKPIKLSDLYSSMVLCGLKTKNNKVAE